MDNPVDILSPEEEWPFSREEMKGLYKITDKVLRIKDEIQRASQNLTDEQSQQLIKSPILEKIQLLDQDPHGARSQYHYHDYSILVSLPKIKLSFFTTIIRKDEELGDLYGSYRDSLVTIYILQSVKKGIFKKQEVWEKLGIWNPAVHGSQSPMARLLQEANIVRSQNIKGPWWPHLRSEMPILQAELEDLEENIYPQIIEQINAFHAENEAANIHDQLDEAIEKRKNF